MRTSSGRLLGDVRKKGRRDFHFRPIYDVFETKFKTFLRRFCDAIVSAELLQKNFVDYEKYKIGNLGENKQVFTVT